MDKKSTTIIADISRIRAATQKNERGKSRMTKTEGSMGSNKVNSDSESFKKRMRELMPQKHQ